MALDIEGSCATGGGIDAYFHQVEVMYLIMPLEHGRRRHAGGTEKDG
jgi:hypothetical protein